MAIAREALHNISSIGGPGAGEPVENLFVKNLWMVENVSYKLPTLGFESETLAGQTIDTGTNAFTFKEPIQIDGIFTPAGHINLNNGTYFISGDGLVNKGLTVNTAGDVTLKQQLTVTGATTLNGALDMNAHIAMGTYNISGAGGNVGLGFSGANATLSGTLDAADQINANKTGQFSISCAGKSYFADNIQVLSGKTISHDGLGASGIAFTSVGGGSVAIFGILNVNGPINLTTPVTINAVAGKTGIATIAAITSITFDNGIATAWS